MFTKYFIITQKKIVITQYASTGAYSDWISQIIYPGPDPKPVFEGPGSIK
jgi:hypothetical protein